MENTKAFTQTTARTFTKEGMTIGVVTNPAANRGHGRAIGLKVISLLLGLESSHGIAIQDLTGTSAQDSLNRIRTSPLTLDALIVVGGDGMVSLGVNAAMELNVPLGIVACGSGNDFARGIGLPINRIETAVTGLIAALTTRSSVPIDLGHVVSSEDGGVRVNKYFAGQLSCGIDAQINIDANHSHLPVGPLRYGTAAVYEITHLKAYGYSVEFNDQAFDFDSPLLSVANSRFIGGGIELSPESDVSDGFLNLIWARWKPTARQGLSLLKGAYKGTHLDSPVIGHELVTAAHLDVSGSGDKPPVAMADGEEVGALPLDVAVETGSLKLLVPPSVVANWESERHHVD